MTALDSEPLGEVDHVPIATTARAGNSDAIHEEAKRPITGPGHAPILMGPVRGRVRFVPTEPVRAAIAYALDPMGQGVGHADVIGDGSAADIALTASAVWYEVVLIR